jgi:hypothetical protein
MTQLLHILKKDIRHLRYHLGLYLLLLGWYAWLETRVWFSYSDSLLLAARANLVPMLIFIFAIYLITRLTHSEAIPGDNQFWLTRPYSWTSLLGAKVALLVLGISLPMLAVRFVVFRVQGFPLLPGIWDLLWSQLIMTAVIALPLAALAALSSGVVQFVISALILIPIISIIYSDAVWLNRWPDSTQWLRDAFAAAVFCGIAAWVLQSQYRTRKTVFSRGFASCALIATGVVYAYAPWSIAYAMNGWLGFSKPMTETSSPHVVLGLHTRSNPAPPSDVVLWQIPVVIEDIPAGFTAELQPVLVTFQSAGKMKRQWFNSGPALSKAPEGTYWAAGAVERSNFDAMKRTPVTVRVMVDLLLFPPPSTQAIHLSKDFANVVGGLQCRGIPIEDWYAKIYPSVKFEGVECRASFGWPNLRVGMTTNEGKPLGPKAITPSDHAAFESPVSLSSVRSNVTYFQYSGPTDVIVTVKGPPLLLHQEFEYRNVRLDEFMEPH